MQFDGQNEWPNEQVLSRRSPDSEDSDIRYRLQNSLHMVTLRIIIIVS